MQVFADIALLVVSIKLSSSVQITPKEDKKIGKLNKSG